MEENKKREEEVETLDLGLPTKKEKINEALEGTSEENIKDTILDNDLNEAVKHENFEEKIMAEDNSADNVFGEEFVGLDNLDGFEKKEAKPKKKGGVVIVIILILLLAAIGGYIWYSKTYVNNDELKDAMNTAALDYYDKYTSANTGAAAYTITLDDLRNANKNGENYKLDSLKDCDGQKTQVIINIDYSNGEAKNTEVKLSCKIF